jgi:predicted  nucleic acid-binding Zn-ribbon protein
VAERDTYSDKVFMLKRERENLDNEAKLLYKRLGSLEQKVENLREQQEELTRLQEEYSAYDLYLKVHAQQWHSV